MLDVGENVVGRTTFGIKDPKVAAAAARLGCRATTNIRVHVCRCHASSCCSA